MILITGGMGFIGIHTAWRFLDAGEEVVLTRHHSYREPEFLKDQLGKRLHVEQVDVRDREAVVRVLEQYRVTDVAHLVAPALNSLPPDEDFDTAVLGLLTILQASRQAGVRRVTLASSVGVYGGIFPIVRLCHVAVRGETALPGPELFAGDAGAPCYVKDCANGIYLLQKAEKLAHRIYNLSVDWAVTNAQIVDAIRTAVPGFDPPLQPGTSPRNRPHGYLDLGRIRADTGYAPAYDLTRSVTDYIGWLRDHPDETMTKEQ